MEVEFQKWHKVTTREIKNDGKTHSYRVRKDETVIFEFDILPGNQIPSSVNKNDEKRKLDGPMRSVPSPGAPKWTLRYLLTREATEQDKAANLFAMNNRFEMIENVQEQREHDRKRLINLVEKEDVPTEDDLEWAVSYLRTSSGILRELLAIEHRSLRRTSTYLYYLIEENVTTVLEDVPGMPVVRLIGNKRYTKPQTRTPAPFQERKTEVMRYELMKEQYKFQRHISDVFAVAFSPDGKLIASGGDDQNVRIWESGSGKQKRQFELSDWCTCLAFSSDGKYLVCGTGTGTVMVLYWEKEDALVWEDNVGRGAVLSVAYSPDGTKIVSGGEYATVHVWNSANGGVPQELKGHRNTIVSVAFLPDGNEIVGGSTDGTIRFWDSTSGSLRKTIEVNDTVDAVAFSPDCTRFIYGNKNGKLYEWDLVGGSEHRTWGLNLNPVFTIVYSPDGSRVVSLGGRDEGAILWETTTSEQLQELTGDSTGIYSMAFSPDSTKIAIGVVSGFVTVWGS